MTSLLSLILITIIVVENQVNATFNSKQNTDPSVDYTYKALLNNMLMFKMEFKVKASKNAHIILSEKEKPGKEDPVLEIFIGSDSNKKSEIRKNLPKPQVEEVNSPNILNENELRGFWVNYLGGYIAVGKENEESPFLTWVDPDPIRVAFFGVSTDEVSGEWEIDNKPNKPMDNMKEVWVDASPGQMPANVVEAGEGVYVGRAIMKNGKIPRKIKKDFNELKNMNVRVSKYDVRKASKYQFLTGTNFMWMKSEMGYIPANAVIGGISVGGGEELYICRQTHMGSLEVGQMQPSKHVCYIEHNDKVLAYPGYEILVQKSP